MFRRFRPYLTLLVIGDVVLTMTALALAVFLRRVLPWGRSLSGQSPLVSPLVYAMVALLWPLAFQMVHVYASQLATNVPGQIRRLTMAVPTAVFGLEGAAYSQVPRDLAAHTGTVRHAHGPRGSVPRGVGVMKIRETDPRQGRATPVPPTQTALNGALAVIGEAEHRESMVRPNLAHASAVAVPE